MDMTITDFLLARIAEDEARARAAIEDDGGSDEGFAGKYQAMTEPPSGIGIAQGGFGEAAARMIATYAVPRRVLAECEAKRRIVELHVVGDPEEWDPAQWACRLCQWDEDCDSPKHDHQHGAGRFPCDTLRALAAVYVDHPDYREEWRP